MRSRLFNKAPSEEDNPYFLSFSDMMSGLLAIFILASIALILELSQIKRNWIEEMTEVTRAEEVRNQMLEEIIAELNAQGIQVHLSENKTVLRIPEEVIHFKTAEYDLPKDEDVLRKIGIIGDTIYKHLTKNNRLNYIDTVFVEGHTDAARYKNVDIKGNWGLSTFRAISLWEFWGASFSEASELQHLKNADGRFMFSVSGYADSRPTACVRRGHETFSKDLCQDGVYSLKDKAIAYSKNRRIDIRFTIRKPTSKEYKELQ